MPVDILPAIRAPSTAELPAARALLTAESPAARYLARAREVVDDIANGSSEHLALVAADGSGLHGLVLGGDVAGSEGAARITAVCVAGARQRRGVGYALVQGAVQALRSRGARVIVAELADDPALAAPRALLARCEFVPAGRVPDFYADGVALLLLERRLTR